MNAIDQTASSIAYERIVRAQRLLNSPDFQWFMEKGNSARALMEEKALDVSLPDESSDLNKKMRAGATVILTIVKVELIEANKAFNEAKAQEDPLYIKKGPEL